MKSKTWAGFVAMVFMAAAVGQTVATAGTFPGTNAKIAFSSEGHIRVINADGTGAKNLDAASPASTVAEPAWNATGKKIVYRAGGSEIKSMNADGTNSKSLVGMPSFAGNPSWSPDGSVVAFDGYIGGIAQENRIYTVPAAGGTATQLAAVDAVDPTYSPDGTQIAYQESAGASDIGIMNADGSGARNITTGPGGNDSDQAPSWSPDGTKIAFMRGEEVWTVAADGSGATQLTTGADAEHPTWSPDGTKIAFQSVDDIWVMDADGTDLVNITNTPDIEDRYPDWGLGGLLPPSEGIGFSASSFEANESDGVAEITVTRTGSTAGTASMNFTTSDGSVKSSNTKFCLGCRVPEPDYLKSSGTLVFGDGDTSQTFRVPIVDDDKIEDDETVNLTLSAVKGGARPGPIPTAVLTITDNDPNVSFGRGAASAEEGAGTARLNVLLSAQASGVTVDYTVTGGTATPGSDFTLSSGTLRFGTTRTPSIPLALIDDDAKEETETVIVELSSPVNAQLGPITELTFSIKDDDAQGDTAGDTPATALAVDLVTQPRQKLREALSSAGDRVDVYKVGLEAGDGLAIDVDEAKGLLGNSLTQSTLTILGPDGATVLATVGASKEPDGSGKTDNPAHLFTAPTAGDYYLQLSSDDARLLSAYSIEFHRLALAEGAQDPETLDKDGPMFAWMNGDMLGFTGPTGYGFGLEGAWSKTTAPNNRTGTTSAVYTLATGETVDFVTAFGELRLESLGPIVVSTAANRWGDTFGEVVEKSIPLRMGIPLDALSDTLRDEFGLDFAVSALEYWKISMGSDIMDGGRGLPAGVNELMPGVPYLLFNDEPSISAIFGEVRIEQPALDQKLLLILDPMDPFLYLRGEELEGARQPTLAFSRRGYIPFHPVLEPTIPSAMGLTDFYSHVFQSAGFPPNPALAEYFTIFADGSIDLDADDDGQWLAGQGNAEALAGGDLSAATEVLRDINLGANGRVIFHYNSDRFDFETPLGRASGVYNGQEEALWFRGRKLIEESPLDGTPLSFLAMSPEDFVEGTIRSDGTFFVTAGTRVDLPGEGLLEIRLDLHNQGIDAEVSGRVELKGSAKIGGVTAKCVARAGASGSLSFSYSDQLHMSGSLRADGSIKCYVNNNKVGSASFDLSARIDDGRLIFKLPYIGDESIRLF